MGDNSNVESVELWIKNIDASNLGIINWQKIHKDVKSMTNLNEKSYIVLLCYHPFRNNMIIKTHCLHENSIDEIYSASYPRLQDLSSSSISSSSDATLFISTGSCFTTSEILTLEPSSLTLISFGLNQVIYEWEEKINLISVLF